MNFNSIKYLFTEGIKNLLNNIFMALASIGVLTACLLIVGFSFLLKINTKRLVSFMGQQSTIIIYLKDNIEEVKIEDLSNTFKNNPNVNSVEFVSKEKALENFSSKFNNPNALKALTEHNVLPASLNVHVKDVNEIEGLLKIAEEEKFESIIEETKSPTKYTNAIKEFNRTTGVFGTILIIVLIVASLIIISNTIRATVFARRREIAIMKQVGATDGFVRFPFLVEGATIGIISAVIAFSLLSVLYKTMILMLTKYSSEFLNLMFSNLIGLKSFGIMMAISFLLCGIIAGAVGSIISLIRYLKI